MSEEVEREDGASKGRYRIVVDGHEAEMTYSRAGKKLIIIDHTDVPAALPWPENWRAIGPVSGRGRPAGRHYDHTALPLRESADRAPSGMAGCFEKVKILPNTEPEPAMENVMGKSTSLLRGKAGPSSYCHQRDEQWPKTLLN